jgi:ATP-dependent Lon protease
MTSESKDRRNEKGTSANKRKFDAGSVIDPGDIESTQQIKIPGDPLMRVIGQGEAISLAKVAASQRRHLLLVGPPGTGKSMIAQALSFHLPPPDEQVYIISNPEYPERPFIQVKTRDEVKAEEERLRERKEKLISPV